MNKPQKIEQFEALAREMVGDDKTPDLFFVTDQGAVVTISRDLSLAYKHWCELAARYPRTECALENRNYGVLADISPESDDPGARLIRQDDVHAFQRRKKMNAYQFFLKHAGFSYDPKSQTKMQGRIKCARAMAKAERAARDGGFSYRWEIDPTASSADWIESGEDGAKGRNPWQVWRCAMFDASGECAASLHSIDFGRDGTPWGDPYKRVVEAELALEHIDNEPTKKARK